MSIRLRSDFARTRAVTTAIVVAVPGLLASPLEGRARAQSPTTAEAAPREKTSEENDLEASRARFRKGMDAYTAGDFAGAIVVWQAIYSELGTERGYRLAFNLGRAHDAFGDAARATELYAAYLDEVGKRRARGDELPSLVLKQAEDAEARIGELVRSRGRVRIVSSKAPVLVSIDGGTARPCGFSALLPPGKHTLIFRTGEADVRREIDVREGEALEIVPPEPTPRDALPRVLPRPPVVEVRAVRPFSPVWIFVGAGATALSVLLPAFQYAHALSVASEHDASDDALARERLASEYSGAKTAAYATMSVPIVLGVATLGLGAAFLLGTKNESVRIGSRGLGLEGCVTF